MARVIETNTIEAWRDLHKFLATCREGTVRQSIDCIHYVRPNNERQSGVNIACGDVGVEFRCSEYSQEFTATYWTTRYGNIKVELSMTPMERDLAAAALGIVLPNLDPAE